MVFASGEIGQALINHFFEGNRYILSLDSEGKRSKMNEHLKRDTSPTPQQVDLDVYAVLKRIQQQLAFLEKKVDTLIRQSSEKPSQERHFSKPFRSPGNFSHSHRPDRGERPREKSFTPGRPFDKPEGQKKQEFGRGRKAFFRRRESRG